MNKELSLLGLAKKAGKAAIGNEAVSDAVRHGYAKLILIASDASDNTKQRFERLSSGEDRVAHVVMPFEKTEIGKILGIAECAIVAVCDAGLAAALATRLAAITGPGGYLTERASRLKAEAERKRKIKNKHNSDENTFGGVR
ncbi:MAG: 50S ribosomal protein L7ae [Clostridiales bacterium]|nr:50S ribosomal protein L7ae [Clostridiales bacterium]